MFRKMPKDVVNLIYRKLHNSNMTDMNTEYCSNIGVPFTSSDGCYILCYRGVSINWRMLEVL